MLKSLFLVASGLLVLSIANVIVPREVSGPNLSLCTDREAAVVPGSSLQVRTPNFGGNYADNTRCNLKLTTGTKPVHLFVTFQTIDLENHQTCSWDSLCLNGVLFCGNWANGRTQEYIVPANNYFTLDFKSDGSVTGLGISLTISATEYVNESVSIATSGYGSSSTSLGYSTYSLSNLYYTDTCGANANRAATSYPYTTTVYDYSTTSYYYYDSTTYNQWDYQTTNDYVYSTNWYYDTTNDYYYSTTYNPWYYQTTYDYYYSTTYNPWYYQTTYDYYYSTTSWYYPTTYDYYYSTTSWYYQTTNDYYYSTTYDPWYYQTTGNLYYYYSTTYNPWYYQTTDNYYYSTTYNPYYYQTTDNYYYSTTYYPRSSPYYETTSYNPWSSASTNYYQYTSGYYYTSTYNPCQNGYYYTTGYCQYYTSSPSSTNDYIANELRRALHEISTERSSQDQLFSILANLLQYLGHK